MNVDNYVIIKGERGELTALNIDHVQAFFQAGEDMVAVLLSGERVYLKGTFIDVVNAVRKQAGVEPATIEQLEAALNGGAE